MIIAAIGFLLAVIVGAFLISYVSLHVIGFPSGSPQAVAFCTIVGVIMGGSLMGLWLYLGWA